jgi:hypothetical protein
MAASISQTQSAAQSLAAYLQALQAKNSNAGQDASLPGNNIATDGTVVNGVNATSGSKTSSDGSSASSQPLDVVTLSAQAQQLLANLQSPSTGPGSLATYLNTSNTIDTAGNGSTNPLGISDIGAIAQFRQWLSQPLAQPVPYPGDQSAGNNSQSGSASQDQTSTSAPVGSTST